jgi:hypothetical protein
MFGMGATVNEQAFSGAQTLVDVIGLIAEPERKRLTEQLRELAEAMKKFEAARSALSRVEARLLERERACETAEKATAARATAAAELEQKAQALLQRAEQAKAEVNALKDDLRQAWSQAA